MKLPNNIKSEKDFREWMQYVASIRGYHVSHVESPVTSSGIPDLNLSKADKDIWIELKIQRKDGVHMLPSQRKWHRERAKAGGISYVLVWTGSQFWVHHGVHAARLTPRDPRWSGGSGPSYAMEDASHWLPALLDRSLSSYSTLPGAIQPPLSRRATLEQLGSGLASDPDFTQGRT